jgi:catechol 2,3-dioxygenase-like lactoylglutathione lyase family enzyme
MTLSSLKRYVTAMGADLEISIRMENGEHVRLAGPVGLKRERAACVHVEQRLSGRDVLPSDTSVEGWTAECGSWLDEMKATAKNRWPRTPDLVLTCGRNEDDWEAASLASSNWSRSEIRISIAGVWGLGKTVLDLGRKCFQGVSLPSVARAVSRTLIGHEIGHFVMEDLSDEFLRRFSHRELQADAVSGWLAGRAADDASLGSMIVSHLGCGSETCSHPTPDARSNAYLLGHLEGSRGRQKSPGMNLVVIRVSDLERSREFYSTLGLDLTPEKHGSGPLHYSCEMNDLVVELYPTKTRPTGGGRIGLRIARPNLAVDRLLSSGHLSERSVSLRREPRAEVLLVRDPDGNDIELSAM